MIPPLPPTYFRSATLKERQLLDKKSLAALPQRCELVGPPVGLIGDPQIAIVVAEALSVVDLVATT